MVIIEKYFSYPRKTAGLAILNEITPNSIQNTL